MPPARSLWHYAKFAGGVVYGLVGANDLSEIEACSHEVYDDGYLVYEGLWLNFWAHRYRALIHAMFKEEKGICITSHSCLNMQDDINAIIDWGQIFTDRQKLVSKVTRNFLLHRKKVMSDISIAKNEWSQGLYFGAGWTASDIVYLTLGPISTAFAEEEEEQGN